MEKDPKRKYTNAEIINSVKIRIDVQKYVLNNEEEQGKKRLTTIIRSQFAEILDVYAKNGTPVLDPLTLHQSELPNFDDAWFMIQYLPKTNDIIQAEQKPGQEKTILSENNYRDWIKYEATIFKHLKQ